MSFVGFVNKTFMTQATPANCITVLQNMNTSSHSPRKESRRVDDFAPYERALRDQSLSVVSKRVRGA